MIQKLIYSLYILKTAYGGVDVPSNSTVSITPKSVVPDASKQFTGVDDFGAIEARIFDGKIYVYEGLNTQGKQSWKALTMEYGTEVNFVITKENKLMLGKGHYNLSGHADEVISAGSMDVYSGKITKLSNGSGHYRPPISNIEATHPVFEDLGVLKDDFDFYTDIERISMD